jgi:hypothetical protein
MPHARTATTAPSGRGGGTGTSRTTSGVRKVVKTAASMA